MPFRSPLRFTLALASLAGAVAGCADDLSAPPEAASELAHVLGDAAPVRLDDLLARINDVAPEFGGIFVDPAGQLTILATDAPDRRTLDAALVRALGLDPAEVAAAPVKKCTYPFEQLHALHTRLAAVVLPLAEVSMTDIDDADNRLTIGLVDASAQERVAALVRAAGVPDDAVGYVVQPLLRPTAKVTEKIRPLRGGLQINRGPSTCTLGFTASRKSVAGFITNSHCTAMQGGNEHTKFGQPLLGEFVGEEAFDLLYWIGEPPCEYPYVCRESDAAFVKSGVTLERKVALLSPGSLEVQGFARVTGRTDWPLQGESARKTGRTTGATEGTIKQACAVLKSTSQHMYFCNHRVSGPDPMSGPGDSGSPVFRVTDHPAKGDARLLGVLWGSSPGSFVFSPLGAIELDMGAISVCAAGFNC